MADNIDVILNCPACGKPMKKVYLNEQEIYLDVCLDSCGGIYFDNREYKKLDEEVEDISPLTNAYVGKQFKEVDENEMRVCPVCSTKMVKHFSSCKEEIQIDECYACGGVFLDFNELERIRAEYNTELDANLDAMKNLFLVMGDDLRNSQERSSKVKENSIIRKFVFNMIKNNYTKQ